MKVLFSLVSISLLCTFGVYSQIPVISLSAYTYKDSNPEIGIVYLHPALGEIRSLRVSGPDSKHVKLDHHMLLLARQKAAAKKELDILLNVESTQGNYQQAFRLVRDEFIRNKVIAHRGAWKNTGVAENSLASLSHAIRLGCEAAEFDVHMSADSVPVINHDPAIQGIAIESSPSSTLLNLRLSSGENMPSLEEYLRAGITQNKTRLVLEIKPSAVSKERAIATTRKVLEIVSRLKAQAWVDYISFDYDICREINRIDSNAKVAYLNGDKSPAQLKADKIWGFDYHFSVLRKNEGWLAAAQNEGLSTNAWTVNDRDTMLWLLDRKVDYITTNEPELLLQVVGGR